MDAPSSKGGGKQSPKPQPQSQDSGTDTPLPKIDLRDANAMRREVNALYREARAGKLPASEATKLCHILEIARRMYEASELEARVELVERQLQTRSR